jgi:beta-N-acetylhexosaminidase
LQPGAVILFKRNYESRAQLTELCAEIHRAGVPPPLISVDQEGGRVIRFGPPFIRLESARVLAQQQTPAKVAELAETMGRELRAVGVEIDYAPVLDVLTNPASEVIADRAFASTAETVSLYGMAYMRGLIAAGIIPCVNHFPGHVNVREDSHRELPINQATRADLDESHLRPFIEAIAARVPMIMVAHLMTPVLDDVHPASLSSRHINDLLRRQLGFNGVIATDDLQMGALDRFGTLAERSVLALEAGADLLLVCREIEAVEDVFAVVGRLTESNGMTVQLGASAARIERLRRTSP